METVLEGEGGGIANGIVGGGGYYKPKNRRGGIASERYQMSGRDMSVYVYSNMHTSLKLRV